MTTKIFQPVHPISDNHELRGGLDSDVDTAQSRFVGHGASGGIDQDVDTAQERPDDQRSSGGVDPQPVQWLTDDHVDAGGPGVHSASDSYSPLGPQPVQSSIDSQTALGGPGVHHSIDSQNLDDFQPVHLLIEGQQRHGGLGDHVRIESHTFSDPQSVHRDSGSQETTGGLGEDAGGAFIAASEASRQTAHPRISFPSPHPELADPLLSFLAAIVDDLEDMRKANENRLRQLTRTETDKDGEVRGFGLDETVPAVARQIGIVAGINKLEKEAIKNLEERMANHPLAVFAQQRGVGLKSLARLLASIGDPYWNSLAGETRGLRQLWAFSGLHNVPVHADTDSQGFSGRDQAGSDQVRNDSQCDFVAARRTRGQKANWSSTAKSRAYLIADTMLKSGNRELYDARKAATEGKTHAAPCIQCGKKGKPAELGTPWRDGHRHADAMRIVSKQVLRQLWELARETHHASDSPRPLSSSQLAFGESDQSSGSPKVGSNSHGLVGGPDHISDSSRVVANSHGTAGESGQSSGSSRRSVNSQVDSGEPELSK